MNHTDIRIKTQQAQDHILYQTVAQLTDLLNDWDLALCENDARDILAAIAQQEAPTPISEPWWAKFMPLAGADYRRGARRADARRTD